MDPSWLARIERRYDVKGGYRAYHRQCQERCAPVQADPTAPIVQKGCEHLRVMPEEAAKRIERIVLERFETRPAAKKSPHLALFDIDDRAFERDLFERILTPEVEQRVRTFFGSEYFVYWYHVTRSAPVPQLGMNSFRWHCDRGPREHLKLLFYLNGWEEHGGGTEFLDLESTRRIAASGYVFAPVETRLADLSPIAQEFGVAYAPWQPEMRAGEGILFQPAGVLHKGQLSTLGPRYVVTLCILPSPIPWRAAQDRDVLLRDGADGKWHDHASHFMDVLAD